jgi:hypothetical protein
MIHSLHSAPEWLQAPFLAVAETLELSTPAYYLSAHPAQFSPELVSRIKLVAKHLSKAAGVQRSMALEWVASALQFQNWHQLSTHFSNAPASSGPRLHEQWASRLKLALVLLHENTPEMEVSEAQIEAFEHLAARLASASGLDIPKVLDEVLARLCSAGNWAEVKNRHPLNTSKPLYQFVVDMDYGEDFSGFVPSEACRQLQQMLDDRCYEEMTEEQEDSLAAWLVPVLKKQPQFLDGGLALAYHLYERHYHVAAGAIVEEQIRKANALIPKGFRGKIIWGRLENRTYHRLLWLQLKIAHDDADLKKCLRLCRRMLKLNPNDNLGARFVLPWLHLEQGEAQKALKAATPGRDQYFCPTMRLAKAFAYFANGDRRRFLEHLLNALFELPMLRSYLLDEHALAPDETGNRGVIPDMELFHHFWWASYQSIEGLSAACKEVLDRKEVQEAEQSLRTYWNGFWQRRQEAVGNYAGWEALNQTLHRSLMNELRHLDVDSGRRLD